MPPRLYQDDPDFVMSPEFLTEEVYEKALSSLIVVCADTIFINRAHRTFYLAERIVDPIRGLWVTGGRMNAGELPVPAACRLVKRETGLEIDPSRLSYVSMYRYISARRKQPPQEKGSDTMAYTFVLEVSPEEVSAIAANLDSNEYNPASGLREFDRAALIETKAHPALLDMYDAVFPSA